VINLMPPDMKEQIRYAKMNRLVLKYVWVTIVVVGVLGGIFGGAYYLIQQQTNAVAADVASKEQDINAQSSALLPKAQDASQRLNAIKYVQDTQTRFSLLIADLVKVIPQGVKLDGISLTGNDQAPVTLQVSAEKYDDILALRNSLVVSPRISAADIVNITSPGSGAPWGGTLAIGFKPGQSK
jgi:Tfp pilus assembly protein PilN